MRHASLLILLTLALPYAAPAAEHEVVVGADGQNAYAPNQLKISAGDTVTFRQVGGFHNVSSAAGSITAFRCGPNGCDGVGGGNGDPGGGTWQQSVAFPDAGTANYFCDVHGQSMSGTIVVNPVPVTLQSFDID